MRLIAGLFTLVSVAAFGFACGALGLVYLAPDPAPFVAPERAAAVTNPDTMGTDLPTTWPAVFGTVPPPEIEPEPEPEPEPAAEAPPEQNTTYILTGLVAGRADSWALISENDRGLVVRVGDELIGGEVVTAIDTEGVWIEVDGQTQLIAPQRPQTEGMVRTEAPAVANLPPAHLLAEITIPMEQLDRRFIERALAEAGRLTATEQDDAAGGMDIVWIQRGELFDQMGLRTGDTILTVNGKTLVTENLLADTPDSELDSGALNLEILRDGARQVLKVNLDQG